MRKAIKERDYQLPDGYRIIKSVWKVPISESFPEGIEFSIQLLYMNYEVWKQVARIDNHLHKGIPGTHLHYDSRVIWKDLTVRQAEKEIRRFIR